MNLPDRGSQEEADMIDRIQAHVHRNWHGYLDIAVLHPNEDVKYGFEEDRKELRKFIRTVLDGLSNEDS